MDDDIELPPLPPKPPVTDPDAAMQAYGRACYKAGVVIGERRAKAEAKPAVREVRIILKPDGGSWFPMGGDYLPKFGEIGVTLRWTADGRAWIESERNRELASSLRREWGFSVAADALDGGVR